MMRLKFNSFLLIGVLGTLSISVLSCKKDKADEPSTSCIAGSGGSSTLIVDLKHHELPIPSDSVYPDTVWLKYNAIDAGSGFDERKIGNPGDSSITFSNLKCGNYFLTASGYDRSIGFIVNGGLGITIAENADTVYATIAVVE